jgi:hypothetical protein
MAFLSQALAFETTSELSAFAEREFCPAAGMEPGQLRELLRGCVHQHSTQSSTDAARRAPPTHAARRTPHAPRANTNPNRTPTPNPRTQPQHRRRAAHAPSPTPRAPPLTEQFVDANAASAARRRWGAWRWRLRRTARRDRRHFRSVR